MKIRSLPLAIIVLALFFGGIALSAAFNLWKTESTKTPAKIKSGEFTGEHEPLQSGISAKKRRLSFLQ